MYYVQWKILLQGLLHYDPQKWLTSRAAMELDFLTELQVSEGRVPVLTVTTSLDHAKNQQVAVQTHSPRVSTKPPLSVALAPTTTCLQNWRPMSLAAAS